MKQIKSFYNLEIVIMKLERDCHEIHDIIRKEVDWWGTLIEKLQKEDYNLTTNNRYIDYGKN